MADLGLPKDVIFDSTNVVRPKQQHTAAAHVISIDRDDISLEAISNKKEVVVCDTHKDRYPTRTINSPT